MTDYMLMEAVALKSNRLEAEEHRVAKVNAEKDEFKHDFGDLDGFRS